MRIFTQTFSDCGFLLDLSPDFIDGARLEQRTERQRKTGWHLAATLREIGIEARLLDNEVYKSLGKGGWEDNFTGEGEESMEETEKILPLRMVLGFMWEEFVVQRLNGKSQFPSVIYRPGQFALDIGGEKIWCSPDGFSPQVKWLDGVRVEDKRGWMGKRTKLPESKYYGDIVPVVEEFKFTWKGAGKDIRKEWLWLNQVAGYCQPEALDTRFARIHVCYVNGFYEKTVVGSPLYVCYWVEFEDEDLQAVRRMLEEHLKVWKRKRKWVGDGEGRRE